jgi:hypothetical protein
MTMNLSDGKALFSGQLQSPSTPGVRGRPVARPTRGAMNELQWRLPYRSDCRQWRWV